VAFGAVLRVGAGVEVLAVVAVTGGLVATTVMTRRVSAGGDVDVGVVCAQAARVKSVKSKKSERLAFAFPGFEKLMDSIVARHHENVISLRTAETEVTFALVRRKRKASGKPQRFGCP
jgi:hypothetical protein